MIESDVVDRADRPVQNCLACQEPIPDCKCPPAASSGESTDDSWVPDILGGAIELGAEIIGSLLD
ncbi:hypothetical protein [Pseudomonas putida]|uniref:Uncharacterized protein n=1 Tax=Pseudomonas putida TaxID=303 RepID=A0A8I1JJ03_PSEPU|nr:hypothetical protein [Pseudomonas putida]MBI6883104.1 hypothetical protein [Pseudomonas putida]